MTADEKTMLEQDAPASGTGRTVLGELSSRESESFEMSCNEASPRGADLSRCPT